MGGKSPLRIFLKGNDDLAGSLLSADEGGRARRGLRDLIQEKYGEAIRIDLMHEPWEDTGAADGRLFAAEPDVVVLSLQPFLERPGLNGFEGAGGLKESFLRIIASVKERLDAHVIVYNCSSYDPADLTHNFYGREETLTLRIQKYNMALMEISAREGISIIDVDRLIAGLAGERHVVAPLRYSAETYQAMGLEFLRVLEDIGFFENRPLIRQIGRKED